MQTSGRFRAAILLSLAVLLGGCGASTVDFGKIHRPERAEALKAYDVFVGTWNWDAEAANVAEPNRKWTGTATWDWALDQRCLHGELSAKTAQAEFKAHGVWTWHPTDRKYIWSMFNNWGYPQDGTASYDAANKKWTMRYTSVGLDGTTSYGQYTITLVDNDTLKWEMCEWADMMRLFKKLEMSGTYRRAS